MVQFFRPTVYIGLVTVKEYWAENYQELGTKIVGGLATKSLSGGLVAKVLVGLASEAP